MINILFFFIHIFGYQIPEAKVIATSDEFATDSKESSFVYSDKDALYRSKDAKDCLENLDDGNPLDMPVILWEPPIINPPKVTEVDP